MGDSASSINVRTSSSLGRRSSTPTKHVVLTAVARKQENDRSIEPELDWRQFSRSNSSLSIGAKSQPHPSELEEYSHSEFRSSLPDATIPKSTLLPSNQEIGQGEGHHHGDPDVGALSDHVKESLSVTTVKDSEDSESEDDSTSQSADSDEEIRKAPNELLIEFIECIQQEDYQNAKKLCKMILIYEPANAEALAFQPVIEERLQIDAEAGEEEESSSSEESGSDLEDSSLETDSSDSEDNESEQEEGEQLSRGDSGIALGCGRHHHHCH